MCEFVIGGVHCPDHTELRAAGSRPLKPLHHPPRLYLFIPRAIGAAQKAALTVLREQPSLANKHLLFKWSYSELEEEEEEGGGRRWELATSQKTIIRC